jgi:hypothetical protein
MVLRVIPSADGGSRVQRTVRADAARRRVGRDNLGRLGGQHASAWSVFLSLFIGQRSRLAVRHDVGARQRPNLGANQRGRASVSSSADHGGASRRLATAGPTEALLDSDARPRYSAMGIDPTTDGFPRRHEPPFAGDSWLACRQPAQEHSTWLR